MASPYACHRQSRSANYSWLMPALPLTATPLATTSVVALSVESAKSIAIVAAIALLAFAVISAWVIKNVTMKIISIVLLLGLGLGVWTQRTNLQDCADRAKAKVDAGIDKGSITCEFFGSEISVF